MNSETWNSDKERITDTSSPNKNKNKQCLYYFRSFPKPCWHA